jgi:hypothetical protein
VKTNRATSIGFQGAALKPREPARGVRLTVPASIGHLNPFEFPSSARLEGLFRRKGLTRLGELDGVPLEELRNFGNCGPRTIAELVHLVERVAAGDYAIPKDPLAPASLTAMIQNLDETVVDLPAREKEIVLLRLGAGKGGQFWTLRKVGNKFRLTRERVRQIMELILPHVRKAGGPGLAAQLRAIAATCTQMVCPLTPQLLSQWLGGKTPGRYPLPVYVRLLGELQPEIPAWPVGQEYRTDPRPGQQEVALKALRGILHEGQWRLPLKTAYKRTTAQSSLRGLSVADFLAGLKHARGLSVTFPKPEQPQVGLRWLAATKAVAAILDESDRALTLKELLARLRATFGAEMGDWSLGSVRRALTLEAYCLSRGVFGLRRHFKMSVPVGRKACADVHDLLQKQNEPLSPFRVVASRQFNWTTKTNGYELAEVMREDGRFVEVRRFHFDLASRFPQKKRRAQAG